MKISYRCQSCTQKIYLFASKCSVCSNTFCKKCLINIPDSNSNSKDFCQRCHKILDQVPSSTPPKPSEKDLEKATHDFISQIESDPFSTFQNLGKIGEGSSSSVFRVRSQSTLKDYALKQLNSNCNTSAFIEFSQSVLSDCNSILKSFALYYFNNQFFILQELMLCNLETFILQVKIIPENVILFILLEVLKGLEFLHRNHKVHRDVKSQNIFLDASGQAKLGDFGCVAQLTQERQMRTTLIGTPLNLAPEIVMGKDYDARVDIWSLGVVAYEILFKETLFGASRSIYELGQRVVNFRPENLRKSSYARVDEVIRRCLAVDPTERAGAKELVECLQPEVNNGESLRFILQSLASVQAS